MLETTAVEHCKTKAERGAGYYSSVPFFQVISVPILFVTLIATLLFSALDSNLAFGQQNSGAVADSESSLSQRFSDEVALSEADWTGTTGEDSGGDLYADNDGGADSSAYESNSKDWEFIIIPYAWLTGIDGDITVRGRSAEVDASFSDLFENLDIAAMLHGEVWWKRKFGFFVDSVYAKLSVDGNTNLPNSTSVDIDDTAKLFLLEFGGLYRAGTWDIGSPYNSFVQRSKPSVTLDLLAGGRYWHLKNELDIHGPAGVLPSEVESDRNWFDFIVGGRVGLDFYKKLTFVVRSDIGGFDLGFSSKISWNIISWIAYELPWYRITPLIGYRALYDDYSDGSGNNRFENNTWLHGPLIGVAFRF
jgi:hypothetical protein